MAASTVSVAETKAWGVGRGAVAWCAVAAALMFGAAAEAVAAAGEEAAQAREILSATGVKGGIIVHLGSGEGKLTAALRASDRFTVHGLDADAAKVEAARAYLHGHGLYGPVSVERFRGASLPYAANLINLVVAEDLGGIAMTEVLRVLAPGGVAYVKGAAGWTKTVKPRPDAIDVWSHYLHDAGNNAVARDTVAGPPRTLQWIAPPLWLRTHETPSGFQAQVCSGGRVFYIFDEGLIGIIDERLPDRWSIICRDAFNGKRLWKRRIEPWGWREWAREKWEGADWTVVRAGRVALPNENQRRLVAVGERLYATLGFRAPLSILDAATGEVIATVKGTEGTNEILAGDGVVVVSIPNAPPATVKRRTAAGPGSGALVAVNGETGKTLWRQATGGIRSLLLAIDAGRVVYQTGKNLIARSLKDGKELWQVEPNERNAATLVAHNGVVLIKGGPSLASYDGASGRLLWRKKVNRDSGAAGVDLFVANGLVWTGMWAVDANLKPARKSARAMTIGLDPRTGKEKKRIVAENLRSPEHHHRCYRNQATDRYLISAMEGIEFLDLRGDGHSQNNWVRGACRLGVMPCNGMVYVPPDQCFCHPGSKLLGYAAIGPASASGRNAVADARRLTKGPAFGTVPAAGAATRDPDAWPTYRHDAARSGATAAAVSGPVARAWRQPLGGNLTAPVAAGGKVLVAARDAHTVYALDAKTGERLWRFTAGGRIDSPPTLHDGLVLFGSADGRVRCLRESDGALVWEFLAAPTDRRIAYFGQVESAWPVHGSVLVHGGVAYVTAGRSTYLDGGIRLYGLDPATGKILHKGLLEGPHPDPRSGRDYSFYTLGANSDVLVGESGHIYMRQKKMTPSLDEVKGKVLSTKGEMDVGLHLFSTAGLLDGSWYNRTFWMHSKRWPGFQLANQAPKSGQLVVVGKDRTYAVRAFYHRNVHSPMFFPGKEGYLLFADKKTNEPQIVGEEGARPPLRWLPQSDYARGRADDVRKLDSKAFGQDKGIGYTRAEPPVWTRWLPVRIRAMVKAAGVLFVAGPPDIYDTKDPYAAFEGRRGARLVSVSAGDGEKLSEAELDVPPVFDGMIASGGRLFVSLTDGSIICLAGRN